MLRFAANISILFQDSPLLERFARARAAGFSAVEFWWPSGADLVAIERAVMSEGLQVVLLNFDAGDMPSGDRGLLSDPDRQAEFRRNVPVALDLAARLNCRHLNALVGLEIPSFGREKQLAMARDNVSWAADRAAEQGATVLIEALNTIENGPYLLPTTRQAADFVRSVGRHNVKLQYDVYHMQRMEGNIAATLREYMGDIAHIQIADSPGRGEPGTGEIHYPYIFHQLEELDYQGFVGLEYRPSTGSTEQSLAWLSEWGGGGVGKVSASPAVGS